MRRGGGGGGGGGGKRTCTVSALPITTVHVQTHVPSGSKVGASGLVLSLQKILRVKEDGDVWLLEQERGRREDHSHTHTHTHTH